MFSDVEKAAPPSYDATNNQGGNSGEPPSYDSLFGQLKAAKESSDGNVSFGKKACGIVTSSIGFLICLSLTLSIPITSIVIGAIYLHDCTIERFIPIYLVVGGAFSLVQNLLSLFQNACQRCKGDTADDQEEQQPNKVTNGFTGLMSCFMTAWFIAGNVWIYRVYNTVNTSDSTSAQFCNHTLYYYAFWITTSVYIMIGLGCLCCIFCCVCMCCSGKKE